MHVFFLISNTNLIVFLNIFKLLIYIIQVFKKIALNTQMHTFIQFHYEGQTHYNRTLNNNQRQKIFAR